MLGILLITWKNGRTVKTYGLNRLEIYNMKFTFICIVIVLSCSVCASGDLEIYPDLKFDLSSEEQRPRLETAEDVSHYNENYRRNPWERPLFENWGTRKQEQDFGLELPELQEIQELLDRNRNELKSEDDIYYNARNFDDVYEDYKNIEKNRDFDRLNFRYPTSHILDDVRPYPHEDDFTFGDDEIGDDVGEDNSHHERHVHQVETSHSSHAEHMPDDKAQKSNKHILKEAFANAKLVDDPSQFAYPPSDPRFFINTESDIGDQKIKPKLEKIPDNKIRVSLRSDEGIQESPKVQHVKSRIDNEPQDDVVVKPRAITNESTGVYIIAVVAGISAAATVGLIAVGIGWYNLQKHVKNASDVEYPAYGVTGPNKDASPSGDRRLAQSAQMYHYQHQKQQIIAMESRAAAGERHGSVSEADSDEENEEGDYTVYECPGLAPTGEMEVKNPLFQDDPTPAQTPPVKPNGDEKK